MFGNQNFAGKTCFDCFHTSPSKDRSRILHGRVVFFRGISDLRLSFRTIKTHRESSIRITDLKRKKNVRFVVFYYSRVDYSSHHRASRLRGGPLEIGGGGGGRKYFSARIFFFLVEVACRIFFSIWKVW